MGNQRAQDYLAEFGETAGTLASLDLEFQYSVLVAVSAKGIFRLYDIV